MILPMREKKKTAATSQPPKRKRGRPPKPLAERHDKANEILSTEAEAEAWRFAARRASLRAGAPISFPEWARRVLNEAARRAKQ